MDECWLQWRGWISITCLLSVSLTACQSACLFPVKFASCSVLFCSVGGFWSTTHRIQYGGKQKLKQRQFSFVFRFLNTNLSGYSNFESRCVCSTVSVVADASFHAWSWFAFLGRWMVGDGRVLLCIESICVSYSSHFYFNGEQIYFIGDEIGEWSINNCVFFPSINTDKYKALEATFNALLIRELFLYPIGHGWRHSPPAESSERVNWSSSNQEFHYCIKNMC